MKPTLVDKFEALVGKTIQKYVKHDDARVLFFTDGTMAHIHAYCGSCDWEKEVTLTDNLTDTDELELGFITKQEYEEARVRRQKEWEKKRAEEIRANELAQLQHLKAKYEMQETL